ncbi:MAG TPA: lipopolysaccharide biosynthesis protein [Erysipelotrichaceae bacterium]|nr:lipopolysaccharide biosynthesis protein [Erysipelotrichaceae bacterium]
MNETNTNIKSKAINGMMWSSGGSFAFQIIRILTQIILARLLWPEAFGLVALVMAFVSVANYLIENGLTLFLIRKQKLEENDAFSLFIANMIFAFIIVTIFVLGSPWISVYLNEPSTQMLLVVSSSAIIFNAYGSVHKAMLTRDLQFRGQTMSMLVAAIVSGIIAVTVSMLNFGVWSIVIYNVSLQLIQTILLTQIYHLDLRGKIDRQFLKEAIIYSWKLMLSGLIHTVYENIFNLIMGALFSVSALGFYSNALKIRDGAAQTLTDAIQKVSFPVLSKLQNQKESMLETSRRILKLSIFIIYPILIGLAATSESIVKVVFNEQWLGMIPIMQILAINGLMIPLHKVNLNILTVIGRTDLYLRLEIIKKIVAFTTISIALWYGVSIIELLWVLFINAQIGYLINVHYSKEFVGYGYIDQIKDISPITLVSFAMGAGVLAVSLLNLGSVSLLGLQVITGFVLYVLLSYLFIKKEFNDVWNILLMFKNKLIKNKV